jgi:signal transduction histidine kinase
MRGSKSCFPKMHCMTLYWKNKLRHLLQTLAFCLTISAIHKAFRPDLAYQIPLVYSLCIGFFTWAFIDFGRSLFTLSDDALWPKGPAAFVFPLVGIGLGYVLGTLAADYWFGWSSWDVRGRTQLWGSLFVSVVVGVAITYYFYLRGKSAHLQAQLAQRQEQATQAQLKLLQAQLEPHMLFNTLANLRTLIALDPVRATAMLDHLIAFLRATLGGSRATAHPLHDEFDRLHDYLELMAIRMGPRLHYTLDLPDALRDLAVPPLLLQPLVENSIQHGLEPKVEGGSITVRAHMQECVLVLEVIDTGLGLPPSFADPPTPPASTASPHCGGFGLSQVRERLATLYGDQAHMQLQAVPAGGTHITLRLPTTP